MNNKKLKRLRKKLANEKKNTKESRQMNKLYADGMPLKFISINEIRGNDASLSPNEI